MLSKPTEYVNVKETNNDPVTKDPLSCKMPLTGELLSRAFGSKDVFKASESWWTTLYFLHISGDNNYSFHN